MENASTGTLAVSGLLIIIIVFVALVLLWLVISVMSGIMQKIEKGNSANRGKPSDVKISSPRLTKLYIALVVCSAIFVTLLAVGLNMLFA